MSVFRSLRDFIWDKLFLDFYFDKHWTFRFKLMNLISGDRLRPALTGAHMHANRMDEPGEIHKKRTAYWVNYMWEIFDKR